MIRLHDVVFVAGFPFKGVVTGFHWSGSLIVEGLDWRVVVRPESCRKV